MRKTVENFNISEEMMAKLDGLRDAGRGARKVFTREEDAIIKEFYVKKDKKELSKMLGVCASTLRQRYRELTEG
jgi:hypothetical protein